MAMTTLKKPLNLISPQELSKNEFWLYTQLGDFHFSFPEKENRLTPNNIGWDVFFKNGHLFAKEVFLLKELPLSLQKKYSDLREKEDDPLCNYNLHYSENFYYLPLNSTKNLYQIKNQATGTEAGIATSLFCLIPSQEVKSIQILHTQDRESLLNAHYSFYLEKNSQLFLILEQELSENSRGIVNLHFYLEEGAKLQVFDLHYSGKISRLTSYAELAGAQAFYGHYGLFLGQKEHHSDATSFTKHLASQSASEQIYISLLNHSSSSAFTGNIYVKEGIRQIKARQLSKSFLLSEKAQAFSRPQLEIHSDEVECSHGASIGHLPNEALFYLKSRALKENLAKVLLLQAEAKEILQRIPQHLEKLIQKRLNYYLAEVAYERA